MAADILPKSALRSALERLDPDDDSHWTRDNIPSLAVLSAMIERKVTRNELQVIDPHLTRDLVRQRLDASIDSVMDGSGTLETPAPEGDAEESPAAVEAPAVEEPAGPTPEEVLAMPRAEVMASIPLLALAEKALVDLSVRQSQEIDALQTKIRETNVNCNLVTRQLARLRKQTQQSDTTMGDYIRSENERRIAKAAKRHALVGAGVTAEAVLATLEMRAPIDIAYAQRQPARGTQRPVHRARPTV